MATGLARGHIARGLILGHMEIPPGKGGFIERRIDRASFAGFVTLMECRQSADGGPHAGSNIDQRNGDTCHRAIRMAVDADQPAVGLHEGLISRLILQGAHMSKGSYVAVNQTWPFGTDG